MNIAIISDTHIPSRARQISDTFREQIRNADYVIHAGDFDSESTLADMQALATELIAVGGNTDPEIGLPSVVGIELGGVAFVVTHGTGSPQTYKQRVARTVQDYADSENPVGIAGHTHEILDTYQDGVRLLNPGSVTGASPAEKATMLTATAENGSLDVEQHELSLGQASNRRQRDIPDCF